MSEAPMKILVAVLAGFLAGTFVQMTPPSPTPAAEAHQESDEHDYTPRVIFPDELAPPPKEGPQSITVSVPLPPAPAAPAAELPPMPTCEASQSP